MYDTSIHRPQRWDMPFSLENGHHDVISDEDAEQLLACDGLKDIDQDSFPAHLSLKDIIKNDVRLHDFDDGDVIIRQGDWGNSVYFIISGIVRIELPGIKAPLSDSLVGRQENKKKSVFRAIAQLWTNHKEPEIRSRTSLDITKGVSTRVKHGRTRIYLQDVSAVLDKYYTARLEAGQWFGEVAALGRTQRVSTVFSEGPSQVLEIRWQGLRDIMRNDRNEGLKHYIEEVFRERSLSMFLRSEPFFQSLNEEQIQRVVNECEFQSYGDYDSVKPFKEIVADENIDKAKNELIIAEEGHYSNGVILIRSGLARVSQKYFNNRRTTGYLSPGHAFGIEEIAAGAKLDAPIENQSRLSAIGFLNVILIPTKLVEELISEGQFSEYISEPKKESSIAARSEPVPDDTLLNQLVDHHYVQGTATMVIDLDRCTRCDDCVKACARAHDNNPRFLRHGPVFGHHMMANACLHCIDPVCMIECPTGAIHRDHDQGLIVINEKTCIGCTQCANNCPFDAIRMVEVRNSKGELIIDSQKHTPLIEATKCDLCIDQISGPACQQSCPHDALQRVDMRNFSSLKELFE